MSARYLTLRHFFSSSALIFITLLKVLSALSLVLRFVCSLGFTSLTCFYSNALEVRFRAKNLVAIRGKSLFLGAQTSFEQCNLQIVTNHWTRVNLDL